MAPTWAVPGLFIVTKKLNTVNRMPKLERSVTWQTVDQLDMGQSDTDIEILHPRDRRSSIFELDTAK